MAGRMLARPNDADKAARAAGAAPVTALAMTARERNALECIADCTEEYGSLTTNRLVTKRDVERLIAKGLAESIGEVYDRTEDRHAEGYRLTEAGAALLAELGAEG
jgi:hypothetical protein